MTLRLLKHEDALIAEQLKSIELPFAKPRPYQTGIILNFLRSWESTLVHLATGGGKSIVMAYLVKYAAEILDLRVVIIIPGLQIIDQFTAHLQRFGIKFGVIQGKNKLFNPLAKVQLCSIDTLIVRNARPKAELMIMDEIHQIMSDKCVGLYKSYDCPKVAFSATPYLKRGFNDIFTRVDWSIKFPELASLGFLILPRYFVLVKIDTGKLRIDKKKDDYATEDLELAVKAKEVFSGIFEDFNKHDEGKPALGFCVSIAHAKAMSEYFTGRGVPADYIDHTKPLPERKLIFDKLKSGKIRIIFNVETLTTGFDFPAIEMILLCRPTRSIILYHQMVGRGTRPYQNGDYVKKSCKVIDFAQCIKMHGFVEDAPAAYFEPQEKEESSNPEFGMTECPACHCIFRMGRDRACPECGLEFSDPNPPEDDPEEEREESVAVEFTPKFLLKYCKKLARLASDRGYRDGFIYIKLHEKYGERIAKEYCPSKRFGRQVQYYMGLEI